MIRIFFVIALVVIGLAGGCATSAKETRTPEIQIPETTYTLEFLTSVQWGDAPQQYNDIAGYADSESGTYLVFVGAQDSVAVVDVSQPENPEILSIIEVPYHKSNHDIFVFERYLYIVTELTYISSTKEFVSLPGLQIVDLSDPRSPKSSFYGESFTSAHTIFVDPETKLLYAAGAYLGDEDRGMRILDISDPLYPREVGSYTKGQVHEVYAKGGLAYTAESEFEKAGRVGVLDVSDLSDIKVLGETTSPWSKPHSTWLSEDARYLVVADEGYRIDYDMWKIFRAESGFSIYEIRNPEMGELTPELRRISYYSHPDTTVHQIYVRGNLLFASWYTEGVKVFDISDPEKPAMIMSFDTSKLTPEFEEFGGAWGLWPYDPRGEYIYVSDMQEGLVVLRMVEK